MGIRRGQFMLDVARQTTSPRKERQRWDIYSGSFALFSADARNSYRRGACCFLLVSRKIEIAGPAAKAVGRGGGAEQRLGSRVADDELVVLD